LRKQERLAASLKALAARVPRDALAAVGVKFAELERQLRAKAASIEDVDTQRRWVVGGSLNRLRCQQPSSIPNGRDNTSGVWCGWALAAHPGNKHKLHAARNTCLPNTWLRCFRRSLTGFLHV
jgi:hypothetical protein